MLVKMTHQHGHRAWWATVLVQVQAIKVTFHLWPWPRPVAYAVNEDWKHCHTMLQTHTQYIYMYMYMYINCIYIYTLYIMCVCAIIIVWISYETSTNCCAIWRIHSPNSGPRENTASPRLKALHTQGIHQPPSPSAGQLRLLNSFIESLGLQEASSKAWHSLGDHWDSYETLEIKGFHLPIGDLDFANIHSSSWILIDDIGIN